MHEEIEVLDLAKRFKKLMHVEPRYITMGYDAVTDTKTILIVDRLLNCKKYNYDCNDDLIFIDGISGEYDFQKMAKFFKEK